MNKKLYTIIVHSENIAGLLNQVTAVFTRRQINIESLNVSASSIQGVHKYTITAWTDEETIEKVVKQIEKKIDVIVLAGFMTILTERFTSHYPKRILNVHQALIPSFCGEGFYGLRVHEEALKYGVKVTGATVHFVNEIPDGGEIIAQKAVYLEENDTPETLQRRVMEQAEWILLPQAAEKVCAEM